MEGPPGQIGGCGVDLEFRVWGLKGRLDGTGTAPPEEKRTADQVRGVKTVDREGKDIVECGRGADADEAEETGYGRSGENGHQGYGCTWMNLVFGVSVIPVN